MTVSAGSNLTTNAGSTVTFAGSVSGGTAPYTDSWNFGDGSTSTGNTLTPSHLYANPGTYTATLTATDSAKHSGSSSTTVTVNDVAPTVTLSDPSATVGVPVNFTATATDISPVVQAAGFTYNWNFGDGTTGTGASPSHTYSAAGTYTVSVTATDEYGKSGTASGAIVISSASLGQHSHRSWIQLAVIAYQAAGSETTAQVNWNAANIDWFDSPDPSYLPTYKAAGDLSWNYDNYYCMYIGGDKYNALVAWCTAHSVPLESMFVHFSVSTVVNLNGTTYTLPVGSRVPAYIWGPSGSDLTANGALVVNNVGNPSFQAFNAAYEAGYVGQYTGIAVDCSTRGLLSDQGGVQSGGTLQEYPNALTYAATVTAYYSDYEKMFPPVYNAGIKQVMNIGDYHSDSTLYPYIDGLIRETILDPSNETDDRFSSLLSDMQSAQAAGVPNIVCTHDTTTAQNQMSALAAYYIAANITDYFCKSDSYSGDVKTNDFFGALNANIGQPIGAAYVFAKGTDPSGFAYTVWARQYTNGFAIYKPFPQWNDLTTGSATATTYTLPAAYKPLNADGSLGTATNQVTLQNGMGAVFIQ